MWKLKHLEGRCNAENESSFAPFAAGNRQAFEKRMKNVEAEYFSVSAFGKRKKVLFYNCKPFVSVLKREVWLVKRNGIGSKTKHFLARFNYLIRA